MIKIKIIHLVLILGVVMGCKRESSHLPVTVPEEFPEAIRISGNPVESMKHFVVDGMIVIDSFVVILDMKKEKPIFVYSAENQEILGNFSSVGRGPGEFESPIIFEHIDLFNSHLNIYDGRLGILTRVDLANSIKENRYIYSSTPIYDTWKENRPIRVYFETANLNCVELEGSWFSLYNKENQSFTDIEFPKLDFPLPDENMNYYIFNPEICYNAALGKFAVSSYSVGYLSFFDTTGTHLNTISYDPDYMEDLESFLLHKSGTPKIYIGNMHADDKHIFALNASEVDRETMEKVELLIFDWDGVPVKKLLLDRAIGAVAFDHENKRMYGYAPYEEELVLYEYDITTWGL